MPDLEKKLINEAAPNSVVVACRFKMPTLEPIWEKEEGVDSVWVYKMKI